MILRTRYWATLQERERDYCSGSGSEEPKLAKHTNGVCLFVRCNWVRRRAILVPPLYSFARTYDTSARGCRPKLTRLANRR